MKLLDAVNTYLDIACIGFDLGHGKTALAVLRVVDRPQVSVDSARTVGARPNMIPVMHGKDYILTAYTEESGRTFIGDGAFARTGDLLELGFKGRPKGREHLISRFVRAVLDTTKHRNTYQWDVPTLLVVGRPSGWDDDDHKAYQRLFDHIGQEWGKTLAPLPCPEFRVLPESRAAFLYLRDFSQQTPETLRSGILILDMGSSTTDWTYSYKFKKPKEPPKSAEDGRNLGAILIDALVLQQAMENLTDDIREKMLNSPRVYYSALIKARAVKEEYFRDPSEFEDQPCYQQFTWGTDLKLDINVDQALMTACLTKPLNTLREGGVPNTILRLIDEESGLGNKTWLEAFRDLLHEAEARCRENERPINLVYLTGGASRMDFVSAVVTEIFPNARLVNDYYPELCIANGLAWAGCWLVRRAEYERQIQVFIEKTFVSLMSKAVEDFLGNIIQNWYTHVIRPPLESATRKWVNMQIGLYDLGNVFAQDFEKHWGPLDLKVLIEVEKWKAIIQNQLEVQTRPITAILGEPRGVELSEEDYETFGGGIVGIFLDEEIRDILFDPFEAVLKAELLKIKSNLFGRFFQETESLMSLVDGWVKMMYSDWVEMAKRELTGPFAKGLVEYVKPRFFAASQRVLLDIE